MRITIALPDDIAEKVCRLPNRDEFVAQAVQAALAREKQDPTPAGAKPSKWAQLVDRIERQPVNLDGYRTDLARDRRDFRRSFGLP